jgi:hypothetical protein
MCLMTAMDLEERGGLPEKLGEQTIILAFDRPQHLQKVNLEIEESEMSRTQELSLASLRMGAKGTRRYSDSNITFRLLSRRSNANGGLCKGDKLGRATVTSLKLQ